MERLQSYLQKQAKFRSTYKVRKILKSRFVERDLARNHRSSHSSRLNSSLMLLLQEFRCPFENSCRIDQVTRRFCPKCRLKKCFVIGMKKEFIMTEEERSVKRRKIEENRIKKSNVSNRPSLGQSQLLDQLIGSSVGGGSHNYQQHRHQHHELKCRSSEAESSFSDSDISNGLSPSVSF